MTRMKLSFLALAIFVLPLAAQAQTDVSGDWVVTIDTPQGAQSLDLALKQAGEDLTGTINSPMGSTEFKGKIVKNDINVSYHLDVQGNALDITMTGTVAGDNINGNLNVGGLGEVPWTAARKKAGAAPAAAAAAPARPAAAPAPAASSNAAAGSNSLTGKWDVTINMAGNAMPATATFTQTGDKVTGTLSSPQGDVPLAGTMTGNSLKFDINVQTPQGDLQITMTGDLGPSGITGKMSLAGLGDADWSATRAK